MSQKKEVETSIEAGGQTPPSNVISLADRRRLKEKQALAESSGSVESNDNKPMPPAKAQQNILTKRTVTTLSVLAAGAILVTVMNMSLLETAPEVHSSHFSSVIGSQSQERGPASIPGQRAGLEPSVGQRDVGLEKKLAKRLAEPGIRGPSSIGSQPSLEQRLRYEFFENKYSLGFRSGKLHSVSYVPSSGFDGNPKYIEDKEQFLMEYRSLLPVSFYEPVRLERDIASSGDGIRETFVLIGDDSIPMGRVLFSMDKFGRLLQMKVEVR